MIIDEAVKARFWAKVDKGKAPDPRDATIVLARGTAEQRGNALVALVRMASVLRIAGGRRTCGGALV